MKNIWMLGVVISLSACASWQAPSEDKLGALPVVRFGDVIPTASDYILFFPAGQPIPTRVLVDGNVFERPAADTLTVALRRDLYAHKQWISYDRKSWIKGKEAFDFTVTLKLPGYDNPNPGLIEVKMNAKRDVSGQ